MPKGFGTDNFFDTLDVFNRQFNLSKCIVNFRYF